MIFCKADKTRDLKPTQVMPASKKTWIAEIVGPRTDALRPRRAHLVQHAGDCGRAQGHPDRGDRE
eukprot:4030574-Lingulodinium_polyedra.AAC.1